jgi:hypothetical protein
MIDAYQHPKALFAAIIAANVMAEYWHCQPLVREVNHIVNNACNVLAKSKHIMFIC